MTIRLLAALSIALSALPGFALDHPLGLFDKETGVVVRSGPLAELTPKAEAFLNQAAPQYVALADKIEPALGSLIANPTLNGVDREQDWYLGVTFQGKERPRLVFAIPTGDAEAMKSALGKGVHARAYEGWLLYSKNQDAIETLPDSPLPAAESIQSAMDETSTRLFGEGDLALFVNIPSMLATYQKQIEEFKSQFEKQLDEPAPGGNPAAVPAMKTGRKLLETVLETLESSTGLASSVTIREDALLADSVFVVQPDSDAGKFLAGQKPSDFAIMKPLPAGWAAYVAMGDGYNEFARLSSELFVNLPTTSEEAAAAMKELWEQEMEASAMALRLGDIEHGAYEIIGLTRFASAEGYMKDYRALLQEMTHVESEGVQQDFTLTPEAETIAGLKVDLVRMTMTIDPSADPTGMSSQMIKLFLGEEGNTQRIAVVDNTVVQSTGGGPEQMETAIKAAQKLRAGSTEQALLPKIQKELGSRGQLLVAYDLPRIVAAFLNVVAESETPLFPPAFGAALDDLAFEPSYGGLLVEIKKNEVHFREIFPAEQVAGLVKLGTALSQAARKGQ